MTNKLPDNTVLPREPVETAVNTLFPLFLKLENRSVLIVGGGKTALEMLQLLLDQAPATQVLMVAPRIDDRINNFALFYPTLKILQKPFEGDDLNGADIILIADNNSENSHYIYTLAKEQGKLVYVADEPVHSDFYLGATVQHGACKIAISNNGRSPAELKKIKTLLAAWLPAALHDVTGNNGVNKTESTFIKQAKQQTGNGDSHAEAYWRRIATYCLFAFFFMFLGHFILSYLPYREMWKGVQELGGSIDNRFYWMIAAGFLAQLVDGALGMGYGVTCTTVLLSMGVNLPAISSSIHTAEMFSSGMSGYTHYKFGNVNKKLFKTLLIPGIIGAVGGAILLSKFGESNANFIKPLLASYTLILGARILLTAMRKKQKPKKVKHVGWLAGAGGFLDSFGGGGWGPLVTSTLISKGRTPKYVIGSVSITEFFVTLASTITFFTFLGVSHWQIIAGLIIGGMLAAPLAARLVGKLPVKTMLIAVGSMVMLWSIYILVRAIL